MKTSPELPIWSAVSYCRVSTADQADSGLGLAAQEAAIAAELSRRGWRLDGRYEDAGASGRSLTGRPQLQLALDQLAAGEAQALVVAKLDRLSRSLLDFASLMERASRQGWAVVALDLGVDTTTPTGRLVANVMMSVAAWEREVIGQRTREALAAKAAQGVRLGRPVELAPETERHIRACRDRGMTLQSIVDELSDAGRPTARGGEWRVGTVAKVLRRAPAPTRE